MADMVVVQAAVDGRLEEIAVSHGIGKANLLRASTTYAVFVDVGRKAAREGRLIDHSEVVRRVERMLATDA